MEKYVVEMLVKGGGLNMEKITAYKRVGSLGL